MNIEVNRVMNHAACSSGISASPGFTSPRASASVNSVVPGQTTPASPWSFTAPTEHS